MTVRIRKFFGMLLLLSLIIIYAIGITSLATDVLGGMPKLIQPAFYLLAGLAWVIPAIILLRWMQTPPCKHSGPTDSH
ncbi:MAG: DUF2842 domain-containing protein [Alphaproteobacteria bacterium]|nr:DUF2842 domain-containing protein [Alphaproteobacteria bacterium]